MFGVGVVIATDDVVVEGSVFGVVSCVAVGVVYSRTSSFIALAYCRIFDGGSRSSSIFFTSSGSSPGWAPCS